MQNHRNNLLIGEISVSWTDCFLLVVWSKRIDNPAVGGKGSWAGICPTYIKWPLLSCNVLLFGIVLGLGVTLWQWITHIIALNRKAANPTQPYIGDVCCMGYPLPLSPCLPLLYSSLFYISFTIQPALCPLWSKRTQCFQSPLLQIFCEVSNSLLSPVPEPFLFLLHLLQIGWPDMGHCIAVHYCT